jgi:hypothetical protein
VGGRGKAAEIPGNKEWQEMGTVTLRMGSRWRDQETTVEEPEKGQSLWKSGKEQKSFQDCGITQVIRVPCSIH